MNDIYKINFFFKLNLNNKQDIFFLIYSIDKQIKVFAIKKKKTNNNNNVVRVNAGEEEV
jgi:hypothetical protein